MTTTEFVTREEYRESGLAMAEILREINGALGLINTAIEMLQGQVRDVKGLTGLQQEQVTLVTESVSVLAEAVDMLNKRTA